MAQFGLSQDGPQKGLFQQQYPRSVYPQGSTTAYLSSIPANSPSTNQTIASRQSDEPSPSMIPGLGLHASPVANTATWQPAPIQEQRGGFEPAALHETADDGDFSEGEIDDLYEPQEAGTTIQAASGSPHARDRSGSYSPHLSPTESHRQSPGLSVNKRKERFHPTEASTMNQNSLQNTDADGSVATDSVREVKRLALDAIRNLRQLDIRFEDYISEGIDRNVLQSLFSDLGLDASQHKTSEGKHQAAADNTLSTTFSKKLSPPEAPSDASPKDISESRKDRIKRLLAAKGPKQTTAAPPKHISSQIHSSTVPKQASTPKKSLEKSKLLQQKMEALRKSREALEKARAEEKEATAVTKDTSTAEAKSSSLSQTGDVRDTSATISNPPINDTDSTAKEQAEQNSSIPGLFLSPDSQAVTNGQTGELNTSQKQTQGSFTRPFGRSRESRPFLIDVSDDDDDADMDIDSVGQRSPSLDQEMSGALQQSSIHGTQLQHKRQGADQAAGLNIPGENGGMKDLASMNEKIQAMKRRIAEAEARKKAKSSVIDSPAMPAPNTTPTQVANVNHEARGSPAFRSPTQNTIISQKDEITASAGLSKLSQAKRDSVDVDRRSRSRAASARLPVIEALRKDKYLELQALRSQVARIQKDLDDSLLEEMQLRADVDSDADEQMIDSASLTGQETPPETAVNNADGVNQDEFISDLEHTGSIEHDTSKDGQERSSRLSMYEQPIHRTATPASKTEEPPRSSTGITEDRETDDSEMEDASDEYEPSEAEPAEPVHVEMLASTTQNQGDSIVNEYSEEHVSLTSPPNSGMPSGRASASEAEEVNHEGENPSELSVPRTDFIPYESPLKYFHSYRFHPQFEQNVEGGLRSLTYSNKIDVRKELCPEELAGQVCPRGALCQFQHFDSMQTPDDQILLQLGAYGNGEDKRKQEEYINGLRQLLTDFRSRKVKDFQTISQGIVEYRAQFVGDRSKVLPLGGVTI